MSPDLSKPSPKERLLLDEDDSMSVANNLVLDDSDGGLSPFPSASEDDAFLRQTESPVVELRFLAKCRTLRKVALENGRV